MALELLSRRLATTTANYIYGAVDATMRKRKVLAVMKKLGKVTYNNGGEPFAEWDIEYNEGELLPYTGTHTFSPIDRWKRAFLDRGGYATTDVIHYHETLTNQGKAALVKVFNKMGNRLKSDVTKQFPARLLRADGNAPGSELEISGLETFFSISGEEASTQCPVGVNNDNYANLDTAGEAYGGAWEEDGDGNSIWPLGTGPVVADFHRPLVVLYDSTKFSSGDPSWKNNCEEALNFGIHHSRRNANSDGELTMVLTWRDGLRIFKDVQRSKQRINVMQNTPLYDVGFRDQWNFDGIDVTDDFDVPNEVAYGLPVGCMELMSARDQLFMVRDDMDLASDSYRFVCDFHGQLKCESIRHFVKWRKIPV